MTRDEATAYLYRTIPQLDAASIVLLARVAAKLPVEALAKRLASSVEIDTGKGHALGPTSAVDYADSALLGALVALRRVK